MGATEHSASPRDTATRTANQLGNDGCAVGVKQPQPQQQHARLSRLLSSSQLVQHVCNEHFIMYPK